MQTMSMKQETAVADRLRPVVYLYAAFNIAVAVLLFSTVSPTLVSGPAQQMASLR